MSGKMVFFVAQIFPSQNAEFVLDYIIYMFDPPKMMVK